GIPAPVRTPIRSAAKAYREAGAIPGTPAPIGIRPVGIVPVRIVKRVVITHSIERIIEPANIGGVIIIIVIIAIGFSVIARAVVVSAVVSFFVIGVFRSAVVVIPLFIGSLLGFFRRTFLIFLFLPFYIRTVIINIILPIGGEPYAKQ